MHTPLAIMLTAALLQGASPDLTGLWEAKLRFGPDIRGPLTITRTGNTWRADIAGFVLPVRVSGQNISFALPDGKGNFRGKLDGSAIIGQWIGSPTYNTGSPFATPVTLTSVRANTWRGAVQPLDDTYSLYLPITRSANGKYATYLRNPERNDGRFIPVTGIELSGTSVTLTGQRGTIAEGRYDDGVMRIPLRGASFDFTKVDSMISSPFFPRPRTERRYTYSTPLQRDDGWRVASVEDVGISREGIEKFVQMLIDMRMDSLATSQIHSLLIARHGKLVVEEYFHGHHRDQPHDLRSASKSWTAVLLGAAMHAGVPITPKTPVYQTMLSAVPANLDARKKTMTLEHLISMTAGFNCAADDAPGNEDVMQSQTAEPDWHRYTLNVPMLTAPGDTIVYCSIEPDLAAGMLEKIAGEPLPEMFYRLVAQPMQMSNYHLFLSPVGAAYGGGGHRFVPRDFMKLAQLMVNEGKWNGKQIISREWARQSGAALRNLTKTQQYGWLWNSLEFPYKGGKVRGFFAGGNGGQIFMGIPDLDLVIAFTGGNYAHPAMFLSQRVFIPNYILPAVN
ncbi:MAG TPA: serine hydrolase domain-containing protein [Longimicrobiales bacterium]